jgi:hypothetical protein
VVPVPCLWAWCPAWCSRSPAQLSAGGPLSAVETPWSHTQNPEHWQDVGWDLMSYQTHLHSLPDTHGWIAPVTTAAAGCSISFASILSHPAGSEKGSLGVRESVLSTGPRLGRLYCCLDVSAQAGCCGRVAVAASVLSDPPGVRLRACVGLHCLL